ncbi:MAG TPA: LysR family transcriptional regulator [Casimicrobiaceae bacterium]
MELSDLRIFRTVAREGGIVRAARRLHRVPSNITTRIQQLEASIGVQLFTRERNRLALSQSGERLLVHADRMLRMADEVRSAIAGDAPSGVLRLGALESTTASRLPAILAAYHKAYPDVSVELITGTNDALTAAVLDRRVEAAFVAEAPVGKDLAHQPLFRERLVIISAAGHVPIRRPQDVDGDSVIAFPNGCHYRRVLQRWLGERRLPSIRVLELGSYHAIVACVASGTGIALAPESVLETVQHATVTRHPLPKVYGDVVTPLVWRASEQSPALIALREMLAGKKPGASRVSPRMARASSRGVDGR